MFLRLLNTFVAFLTFLSVASAALPHISAKGSKFYTANGDQFFLKGIAYQLDPLDTLFNPAQCRLDAKLMKRLGANTIRAYHVQMPRDHSGCMKAFEDAGIYVFIDLDTFSSDIDQYQPKWTRPQARAFEAVMDEFQKYDNTAGFFIGNEVLTIANLSEAAPFIKAAARDMKAYRDSKGYRKIPIGYSHADVLDLRPHLQNYLACGDNDAESIDFFGLNAYEWCGDNTYDASGYDDLTAQITRYPKPIFLSETGCNIPEPRLFQDQNAIFGPKMSPYWAGAIVYEWIQEDNHYGLVAYNRENTDAVLSTATSFARSGTPYPVLPDFSNLLKVWATATAKSTPAAAYTPHLTPPPCPAYTAGFWEVAGNVVLPSLGESLSKEAQFSITAGLSHAPPPPPSSSYTHTHTHTSTRSHRTKSTSKSTSSSSSTRERTSSSTSRKTTTREPASSSSKRTSSSSSSRKPSLTGGNPIGHPKGKPHQTAATTTTNTGGAAPGLSPPSFHPSLHTSSETEVLALLFTVGGFMLGFTYWL